MPEFQPPHDLFGAVETYLAAKGRPCLAACRGSAHVLTVDLPCEGLAEQVLRQRYAEARAIPGQSEGSVMWSLVQRLFDDVARVVAADEPQAPLARFTDLPDADQSRIVSGMRGVFGQFANLARNKAKP